jgi:hypothetical protein
MSVDGLTFDPVRHRYAYKGKPVPNVTTILQEARLVDLEGVSPEVLRIAGERGTDAHGACQLHDQDDLDEDSIDDTVRPYLTAWRKFRAETNAEIQAVEQQVYNPAWQYAGTLDRLLAFAGREWIGDIKTGVPQRATGVQLAAYRACLPKSEQRRQRVAIHLRADGTYGLIHYDDHGDTHVFYAALTLYRWRGLTP